MPYAQVGGITLYYEVNGELAMIPGSSMIDLPGGHLTLVMVHGKVLAEAISSFLSEA